MSIDQTMEDLEIATSRLEKYGGITLLVQHSWAEIVHDATGYQVSGPVTNYEHLKSVVRVALNTFKELEKLGGKA